MFSANLAARERYPQEVQYSIRTWVPLPSAIGRSFLGAPRVRPHVAQPARKPDAALSATAEAHSLRESPRLG